MERVNRETAPRFFSLRVTRLFVLTLAAAAFLFATSVTIARRAGDGWYTNGLLMAVLAVAIAACLAPRVSMRAAVGALMTSLIALAAVQRLHL